MGVSPPVVGIAATTLHLVLLSSKGITSGSRLSTMYLLAAAVTVHIPVAGTREQLRCSLASSSFISVHDFSLPAFQIADLRHTRHCNAPSS